MEKGSSVSVFISDGEALQLLDALAEREKRSRSDTLTLILQKYLPGLLSDKESLI